LVKEIEKAKASAPIKPQEPNQGIGVCFCTGNGVHDMLSKFTSFKPPGTEFA
jgi:hypothetical protein